MANISNNANDISISNLKKIILHGESTQEILLPVEDPTQVSATDEALETLELVFNDFSIILNNDECPLVTKNGKVFKGYLKNVVEEPSELTDYVNVTLNLIYVEGIEGSETESVPVPVISIKVGQHKVQTEQA